MSGVRRSFSRLRQNASPLLDGSCHRLSPRFNAPETPRRRSICSRLPAVYSLTSTGSYRLKTFLSSGRESRLWPSIKLFVTPRKESSRPASSQRLIQLDISNDSLSVPPIFDCNIDASPILRPSKKYSREVFTPIKVSRLKCEKYYSCNSSGTKYTQNSNVLIKKENGGSPFSGPEINTPFRELLLKQYGKKMTEALQNLPEIRILGQGSFGCVVFGLFKGSRVATKITQQPLHHNIGEKNALSLHHPNVIQTLQIYDTPFKRRLVLMEYGGHQNLQSVLDSAVGYLERNQRNGIAVQVSSAVAYCHENGIVHRDVKPANITVSSSWVCKLTDFGSAVPIRILYSADVTGIVKTVSRMFGTVRYTAPEAFCGQFPAPHHDVYSVGIVLWQLLTNQIPYATEASHTVIYT
ncbi:probable serine/threonine-protein kinase DDB_G0267514, partial [Limulus polyphemus]|uniref:non-specific serine/threonine protein kinase n=1 Tax=Limulus polyphemus TaxID=6850 RepID=A0ABM1BWP3_LIMPO